jgi:PAS domain S-box-containing protein
MSWLALIWSAVIGACLMQALMHLLVWNHDRRSWAHLCFVFTVLSTAGLAMAELLTMHASSPQTFGRIIFWAHCVYGLGVFASLGFVHFFFGSGRNWLLAMALASRALAVVANVVTGVNLHIHAIHSLKQIPFLGSQVSVLGEWEPNPWVRLGQTAALLQLLYIFDASVRLWRRQSPDARRRATVVGGSLAVFILTAATQTGLVSAGILQMPLIVSLPFLGMTMAMGYELSRDVLRAARLSRELQTSERRLAMAASAARLALWEWDLSSNRIWVSNNGRALYGVPDQEEIDFDRFLQTVHPEDHRLVRTAIEKALHGHESYHIDYRVVRPDGHLRWMAARGTIEKNAQGLANRLRGISMDITEQKESEDRFRRVIEAAPNAMAMIDDHGHIRLVNAQMESVFGYTRAELLDAPLEQLVPGSLALFPTTASPSAPASEQEPHPRAVVEKTGWRKDGSPVPIEIRLSPISTPQGKFVLASILDVTRRRLAEREAAHQRQELAHLSRISILGELSGSLAHELNQPLAAILSNSQVGRKSLALPSPDLTELAAILEDITADAKRGGSIIHGMRAMFRKTSPTEIESVDLNTAVHQVLNLINSEIIARHVSLDLQLAPDLPPAGASLVEIQQILMNLMVNSLDAVKTTNTPGLIKITSRFQDDQIIVSVHDNGPGLAPVQLENLFEPFATTKTNGLGLGLAISRRLTERFAGTLQGANHPEGGAIFHLTLPAKFDLESPPPAAPVPVPPPPLAPHRS